MKSLNSPNICVGGLEPVSVVYIEVSNIKNFSVYEQDDFVAFMNDAFERIIVRCIPS